MIKTAIIDDSEDIRKNNIRLLRSNFPEISIAGTAGSVEKGVELIQTTSPDLVLLDIELTDGTGFDILQQLDNIPFKLIFITAFNDFAIKAIKYSAIDYILKPVNEMEFIAGIERAIREMENKGLEKQIETFFDHYEKKTQSKKIVLKTIDSLHLIDIHDIVHCISDNSYTTFFFMDKQPIVISQSIKSFEELLNDFGFFRPHQSHLVNLNYVEKIDKSDGGFIVMKNGKEIPVSVRRKQKLIETLSRF